MRNTLASFPSIPEQMMICRVTRLNNLQCLGTQLILGDMEYDLEEWVIMMQNQEYPVLIDMILPKSDISFRQ